MNRTLIGFVLIGLALAALAFAPTQMGAYGVGLLLGMTGYVTLASAWALFSGPTRYISLATVAFFGIGAYTVAVLSETLPYPLVLVTAGLIGLAVALVVGLATLRLAGIYFVIFTFGLAELIRQLVTWYEVNVTGTLGRYIFLPISAEQIFYRLVDFPLADRAGAQGHRRRRNRCRPYRHRHLPRQARALCGQRHDHHAGRRHPGPALDLYRAGHRL
jgi:branched-chain amino acid transport system permease protein